MPESINISLDGLTPDQVSQLVAFARQLGAEKPDRPLARDESWRTAQSTGWTSDHVGILQARLATRGNEVQLAAFHAAINNGGNVSRDEVFRIGGYEPTRQLKNWTKPFRTIFAELVDELDLPESAELPMEATYTEGKGFRQAYGFSVAAEIVKLVRGSMCDACWALKATGTGGRHTSPHSALEPVGNVREVAGMGMRADEQDYRCTTCGKTWMHETGNSGMGWVE